MKKVIIMALILAPLSLFAQQKFGHFDSSVIVQAMPEYKTSQTELQTLSKQYEDELTRMRDELQKKSQEYDKQRDSLPDNVKQRREQELQELYQRIQQSYNDNRDSLQAKSAEKMQAITQKILQAVQAIGDEGKYVYIMDTTGGIPYISQTLRQNRISWQESLRSAICTSAPSQKQALLRRMRCSTRTTGTTSLTSSPT